MFGKKKMEQDFQKQPAKQDYFLEVAGFDYPEGFEKLIDLGLVDFDSWYLFHSSFLEERYKGLKKRYPERKLIPFARLDGTDDIACFEIGRGGKVEIIHDFADSGWEQRGEFQTIWEWLGFVVNILIKENEEE